MIVLVLDAGTEEGARLARKLLRDGHQVAISSRVATDLVPLMHGYPSSRVLAVAADPADPAQMARLETRVRDYFGADKSYTVASPMLIGRNVAATQLPMSA
jgi:NAD(P)-dependent dehydrogenase (short-subunit alcohol dehydrogenase family)